MSLLATAALLVSTALATEPTVPAAAEGLGQGIRIQLSQTIDATPEATWGLFAEDFADIADWSGVPSSRALTAAEVPAGFVPDSDAPIPGRVVESPRGPQQHVLTDYDEAAGTFTFRSAGLPPVMAYAQNTHTIEALPDGRTQVWVDVYIVPRGIAKLMRGKLAETFTEYMEAYLDESRAQLEGSATSDAQ